MRSELEKVLNEPPTASATPFNRWENWGSEVKWLTLGHTALKWWCGDQTMCVWPQACDLTIRPHCPVASSLKLILCIKGFTSCCKIRRNPFLCLPSCGVSKKQWRGGVLVYSRIIKAGLPVSPFVILHSYSHAFSTVLSHTHTHILSSYHL